MLRSPQCVLQWLDEELFTRSHRIERMREAVAGDEPRPSALAGFTCELAARSAAERMTTRLWFPFAEMAVLREVAHAAIVCEFNKPADVHALRELAAIADRLGVDPATLTVVFVQGRPPDELISLFDRARGRDRQLVVQQIDSRTSVVFAHDPALVPALARAWDDDLSTLLLVRERRSDFAEELLRALRELAEALTHFMGGDISDVDLTGIPLVGVRWSGTTIWPPGQTGELRRRSMELGAGVLQVY